MTSRRAIDGAFLFFSAFALMIGAAFISRATLSVSVAIFFVASLAHRQHKQQWTKFTGTPLLWGISLLFFIPFISGIWSEDRQRWWELVQLKLPLLALPFAFASPVGISRIRWRWLGGIVLAITVITTVWIFLIYLGDFERINENYLAAKTLPAAFENDRVRYSWWVALVSAFTLLACIRSPRENPARWVLFIAGAWLAVFLHILAVRTGLICFYFVTAILLLAYTRKKIAVLIVIAILLLPVLSYQLMPSFQNRVDYLLYESDFARSGGYLPGSTDPVRVISIRGGIDLFKENFLSGVGIGDVQSNMNLWYGRYFPAMIPRDRILPSSEFVFYAAATGICGLLVLITVLLLPFFMKLPERAAWLAMSVAVLVLFAFDIPLETQYGVFVYVVPVIALWKMLQNGEVHNER